MSVSTEQVQHLNRLARIGATPAQTEAYAAQLSRIMELVAQMQRIDSAQVSPMAHPQEYYAELAATKAKTATEANAKTETKTTTQTEAAQSGLRLREDKADSSDQRAAFQRIAPATEGDLYLVPQVIE